MDDTVKRAIAALCLLPLTAGAQMLRDPTRPPDAILAPRAGAGADAVPPPVSGPTLQSVLIARHPGGRHVAVIDGQTVALGENFKGARVTRMTDNEVVLVKGNTRQVLKLFPRPAKPGTPVVNR